MQFNFLFLAFFLVIHAEGYSIQCVNQVTVTEGENLRLSCTAPKEFEYCDLIRGFHECRFYWKSGTS